MRQKLLHLLRCPDCQSEFRLNDATTQPSADIQSGLLECSQGHRYPIRDGIPRFVPRENYASNFGFQWKRYGQVQIDSYAGNSISRDRFLATTGWTPERIGGRLVLDGGCGGGRFAEIALSLGAEVVALDYSEAIDACKSNLARYSDRLHLVQGDILRPPFASSTFDFAYTMGVLQHTPSPHQGFVRLARLVRPGGEFVADAYERSLLRYLNSIYWYRPLIKRLPPDMQFSLVVRLVKALQPTKDALMRRFDGKPLLRVLTSMLIPINAHHWQFPSLTREQAEAWSVMNTFDAYSPKFDQPQDRSTMRSWSEEVGLENVEVFVDPGKGDGTALVCRGRVRTSMPAR